MPVFEIQDARGRRLEIEGDGVPTEDQLTAIFSSAFPEEPLRPPRKSPDDKSRPLMTKRVDSSKNTLGETGILDVLKRPFQETGDTLSMAELGAASPTIKALTADERAEPGRSLARGMAAAEAGLRGIAQVGKEAEVQRLKERPITFREHVQGQMMEGIQDTNDPGSVIRSIVTGATEREAESGAQKLAIARSTQQLVPRSKAVEEWQNASEKDWWKVFAKNPVEIAVSIMAESLPQSAAGIASGAVLGAEAGPAGVAAGIGGGSFLMEYGASMLQSAAEAGFDLTKPEDVRAAFSNPKAVAEWKAHALKRGVPIALFDAATAGVAGRALAPALRTGSTKEIAKATGKEVLSEALGGAAGEGTAQAVSGEETSLKEIAAEAIGEIVTGPTDVMSNLRSRAAETVAQELDAADAPETAAVVRDKAAGGFGSFLRETGMTAEEYRAASESTGDLVPMPEAFADRIVIRESPTEGQGVFIQQPVEAGQVVAPAFVYEDGVQRTPVGRFINHADDALANTMLEVQDGMGVLVAKRPLRAGEELTFDYRQHAPVVQQLQEGAQNAVYEKADEVLRDVQGQPAEGQGVPRPSGLGEDAGTRSQAAQTEASLTDVIESELKAEDPLVEHVRNLGAAIQGLQEALTKQQITPTKPEPSAATIQPKSVAQPAPQPQEATPAEVAFPSVPPAAPQLTPEKLRQSVSGKPTSELAESFDVGNLPQRILDLIDTDTEVVRGRIGELGVTIKTGNGKVMAIAEDRQGNSGAAYIKPFSGRNLMGGSWAIQGEGTVSREYAIKAGEFLLAEIGKLQSQTPITEQTAETPLGVNRPPVRDKSLELMTDAEFDAAQAEATQAVDALENARAAGQTVDTQQLAQAQDAFSSVELERFRRNARETDARDLFDQLRGIADTAARNPDSAARAQAQILLEEIQRQGATKEQILSEIRLASPDAAEVFAGQLEDIKTLATDPIEDALTKAIEATRVDPTKLQEGVSGAPVWMTKAALNGVLRVIRAAYRGSRKLAQAINDGVEWLRARGLKGFNADEARSYLESIMGAQPYVKGKLGRVASRIIHGSALPKEWRGVQIWGNNMRKYIEEKLRLSVEDAKSALEAEFKAEADREAARGRLSAYWLGEADLDTVGGPALQRTAKAVREYIDNLSQLAVRNGLLSDTMAQTWTDNLGTWMRRTYMAFDPQASWNYDTLKGKKEKGDKEITRIWNNVERYLRSQMPNATDEQIEGAMRTLIDRVEVESIIKTGVLPGSSDKRFATDITSLLRRKDIAPEIRDWMGEIKDPFARAMLSSKWMAQFIARNLTQRRMARIGLELIRNEL